MPQTMHKILHWLQTKLFSKSGGGGIIKKSEILQTNAIKGATVSDEKVVQLNAPRPKSWDSTSASTYSKKVILQLKACW